MTLWVWPFLSSLLPCGARKEDHDASCQLLLPPSGKPGLGGETGFAGLGSCGESCPCPVGVHMTLCVAKSRSSQAQSSPPCRLPTSCHASEQGGPSQLGSRWPVPGRGQSCGRGSEAPWRARCGTRARSLLASPVSGQWVVFPGACGSVAPPPSLWGAGSSSRPCPALLALSHHPGPGDGSAGPSCPSRDREIGFSFSLSYQSHVGPVRWCSPCRGSHWEGT